MAMGADRGRITKMVVWQGMRLALAGVVIGVGCGVRVEQAGGESAVWREAVRSCGVCDGAGGAEHGGAVCGLAAGVEGVEAGPDGSAAERVSWRAKPCQVDERAL